MSAKEIVFVGRVSKQGRQIYINIPKHVREAYELSPGDTVEVRMRIIKKAEEERREGG